MSFDAIGFIADLETENGNYTKQEISDFITW